jgi:hypothetical protein
MIQVSDGDDVQAPPIAKASLKERLSALFDKFGRIAFFTFIALSVLTTIGFSVAFMIGLAPSTSTGVIGVIAAGWVAAKATLPIRILITLALTPVIAWIVTRRRRTTSDAPPETPRAPSPAADAPPR